MQSLTESGNFFLRKESISFDFHRKFRHGRSWKASIAIKILQLIYFNVANNKNLTQWKLSISAFSQV